MIRKVQLLNNKSKNLFIVLPKDVEEKMNLSKGTEVQIELTGKTLHIKKAVLL